MKYLLILPIYAFAGLAIMEEAPSYDFNKPKAQKTKMKRKVKKSNEIEQLLNSIQAKDMELNELLEKNNKKILVKKSIETIRPLTRLRGTLLNSIIATNNRATKLLVRVEENEYFTEAELLCLGTTFGKRVISKCNLLVSELHNYKVDVELWDMDGAEGIVSDEYYSGEEKEFLASSFASFFEGVLDGARDRIVTPFGETTPNTAKNKVMSGLMNIANNANTKFTESSEKNLELALVYAGKEVVIFFNQELRLEN